MEKERFPASPEADGFRFIPSYLIGFQPVAQHGKRLGTLYIQSDMKAISARLKLYGAAAGLVAAVAFLLAFALARSPPRQSSGPIVPLAETAGRSSAHRDSSVRARHLKGGEMENLPDAFNHMLPHVREQIARMELLSSITRAIGERLDAPSILRV